jgi:predicted nucleic acid-binding protein
MIDPPAFADASGIYAFMDEDDPYHRDAVGFIASRRRLITSDYVFSEIVTLVRYQLGHSPATAIGEKLRASDFCTIVTVQPADLEAAWEIFRRYSDQRFSFTDCTSFALMQRLGLQDAFAFDHHFWVAGFTKVP